MHASGDLICVWVHARTVRILDVSFDIVNLTNLKNNEEPVRGHSIVIRMRDVLVLEVNGIFSRDGFFFSQGGYSSGAAVGPVKASWEPAKSWRGPA